TDSDISDYTYERTMKMEERNQLLKNLNKSDREKDIQNHLEIVTRERKLSRINEEAMRKNLSKHQKNWNTKGVRFSDDEESKEPKLGNGTLERDREERQRKRRYNVHKNAHGCQVERADASEIVGSAIGVCQLARTAGR
uniref:Uncharacterized protein n=1 Tax=Caenorhabditis japonica TaxID=281687 RepID=A0A8R1ISB8_CAEJA